MPQMMLPMMHQPRLHQPWRLGRCTSFILLFTLGFVRAETVAPVYCRLPEARATVPQMMLLMMHQPHVHQPWRLGRCNLFMDWHAWPCRLPEARATVPLMSQELYDEFKDMQPFHSLAHVSMQAPGGARDGAADVTGAVRRVQGPAALGGRHLRQALCRGLTGSTTRGRCLFFAA